MRSFSIHLIGQLARKELREILRDRRTILTLVLMPILLYPLLSIAFRQYFSSMAAPESAKGFVVAVQTENEMQMVMPLLRLGPNDPVLDWRQSDDLQAAVRSRDAQVGISVTRVPTRGLARAFGPNFQCELIALEDSAAGLNAMEFVRGRLEQANVQILKNRLEQVGLAGSADPVAVKNNLIASEEGRAVSALATVVPLILVLMTITGAVYPAIDLTAGERERGTLELLMAAPVPRGSLLLAKYFAVFIVATLTGLVNLTMMTVTVTAGGLGPLVFGDAGLSVGTVISVLALMLLFAAFFAAVLLAVTSFARSFKEAQAYLIPLMLLSISPGILALMPSVHLGGFLTIMPLINVVLLARDIFHGAASRAHILVVVISTLLYAAAAIAVAARLFGAEAVLYSEQGQWQDFFRRPRRQRSGPSPAVAMFCVAVVFPLSVLAGGLLSQLSVPAPTRLLIGIGISAALFLGVPVLVAWRANINVKTGFGLYRTRILSFVAAVLVGTAMWPLAAEMLVVEKKIGFSSMPEAVERRLSDLVGQQREIPSYIVLLALAVAPAAFEELFFRGWLFAALERSMKPAYVVLVTSIAFGLFHIFTGGVLLVERLLPTTMIGMALGWVRWQSRSIFPGILLHLVHNGLIVSASLFPEALGPMSKALQGSSHVPIEWLIAGAFMTASGIALTWVGRSSTVPPSA